MDGTVQMRDSNTLNEVSGPSMALQTEVKTEVKTEGAEPNPKRIKTEPGHADPRPIPTSLCFLANDCGVAALDVRSRLHVASVDTPLLIGSATKFPVEERGIPTPNPAPKLAPLSQEWLLHALARCVAAKTDAWDVCMAVRAEEERRQAPESPLQPFELHTGRV